jgi:aminoglycoside phosphotransferase (APT) family kinase protein
MADPFALDDGALTRWLSANVAGFVGPAVSRKFAAGQSNPTYLIEAPSGRLVLRRKPPGKLLKSAHMVEREHRVMKALGGVGYPVPPMRGLCEDESVIGSVFFVMDFLDGRIFWDPALPDLPREARAGVYDAMNAALAQLHSVDPAAAGLADFGKAGSYFARQFGRWSEQYRVSETTPYPDMDRLIGWLADNLPQDDGRVAVVHGDWRIDNLMFSPDASRLIGVLDWELATLGHPFADLAYQCMQWRLPNDAVFPGLGGIDRAAQGLPDEAAYVGAYARRMGLSEIPRWTSLLAFAFFRLGAILQGVGKRALEGNASNPEKARAYGASVPVLARIAARMIEAEGG